ncbi:MAG: PLP-dependent transferase [Bryobacteraceae bacterium]
MAEHKDHPQEVRPRTAVLTRGFDPSLSVGSARPAVFRSSTYVFSSPELAERAFDIMSGRAKATPGESVDLIYSRFNHPNAQILEDQIVPLEQGAHAACVFNSGMAAIMTAFLTFSKPGDTIAYSVPIYGGTQHMLKDFLEPWGIHGAPFRAGNAAEMEAAILGAPNLSQVIIETPANPTLKMTDLRAAVAAIERRAASGAPRPLLVVDNTFLGPAFQHPLLVGADIIIYSATKYLSGFSDMIAGVALASDPALIAKLRSKRGLFGNILQPDECWMLDSRLPTVGLRMNRASKNAQHIAEALNGNPKIAKVFYPTLFDDPDQARIYEEQCDYPGAIVSIDLQGGKPAAFDFLRSLKIGKNAVSLGGVETLVCHPKSTTHSGFSDQECELAGVTDGLVRISVGVEDWRDLLHDFQQALETIKEPAFAG